MKNLLISGCSFTQGWEAWPWIVRDHFGFENTYNVGEGGAGNHYIANSIIDCIHYKNLKPDDTMVLVMWSGADRLDKLVSGEYWYLLSDYEPKKHLDDHPDTYWVFSGGRSNSWRDHSEVRKLFQHDYVAFDPQVFCKKTLQNMVALQDFLEHNKFTYRFMSFTNCWDPDNEMAGPMSWSVGHFGKDFPLLQEINFDRWIFVNEKRDGIYELCRDLQLLKDDDFHPNHEGQSLFSRDILIPQIQHLIKG